MNVDYKEQAIANAKNYAEKHSVPMMVVYSEHGGYQGFPAKVSVSEEYTVVWRSE